MYCIQILYYFQFHEGSLLFIHLHILISSNHNLYIEKYEAIIACNSEIFENGEVKKMSFRIFLFKRNTEVLLVL